MSLSFRFAKSITKPISALQDGVSTIASGNSDYMIDIKTNDEIETLGEKVNEMAVDLKEYINNLSKVTAEKERIGAELNVATGIQKSMLPCIFPPYPEREEFDIFATMTPAKEVGGDFYDFFFVNDDNLAIVMADVSGKGIPAELFMVIAKTLIKNNAQYGKNPKETLEAVNNLLCENNEAGMFVTAFLGNIELSTGKFTYANAFEDGGVEYNPLEKKDPDIKLDVNDREVGGPGIHMVKKIMDRVEYVYKDKKNILTLKKNLN